MVTVRTLAVALLSSNFCSHTLAWQWPFQQFIFASSGAAAVYNSESLENVDDGIKRVAIIGVCVMFFRCSPRSSIYCR